MDNHTLMMLVLGGMVGVFISGRWNQAVAAWIGPIFLLYVSHHAPLQESLFAIWAAISFSIFISHWRVIPLPVFVYPVVVAFIAATVVIPYWVERLLAPSIPGAWSTLVFPLAVTAGEYFGARLSPFGTWGSTAYTQIGSRALVQLASVTGLWGIVFLVSWFSSLALWIWEHRATPWESLPVVLLYAVLLMLTLVWGQRRIKCTEGTVRTVRVAAIAWPDGILELKELLRVFYRNLAQEEKAHLLAAFARINEHFMDRTIDAARAGARIVVWPEANIVVQRDEEEALLARLQVLAREYQLYLVAGLAVIDRLPVGKFQNKAVLFAPDGTLAASYIKTKQLPGLEQRYSVPGSRKLPIVMTPYGRMSIAICYDLDFPQHIRQAGHMQADLLLAPASDWREIGKLHHTAAVFRAVENGMSMVRAARWGWASAVSATGRELSIADHYTTPNPVMLADLPCESHRTMYVRLGDSFAWLCLFALLVLMFRAL